MPSNTNHHGYLHSTSRPKIATNNFFSNPFDQQRIQIGLKSPVSAHTLDNMKTQSTLKSEEAHPCLGSEKFN